MYRHLVHCSREYKDLITSQISTGEFAILSQASKRHLIIDQCCTATRLKLSQSFLTATWLVYQPVLV